ncbi:MAG TPA: MlaD family protein [Roseiarcus sp.]|jgi:phospholipid/cholesterol/gamma-HCH transport system substrate-binding protein|nr:MlaD family protein [Roseiarcus sp.]
METRANFILIGAFTLGAVVAAFLFVMWIAGYGATGAHRRYQIIFNGSVSGLSPGATVLFNGLKVGEVTTLGFVKGNPSQVVADIDVTNASAPINSDTKAQLETQGLTGSATVALIGGEKGGELTGNPPVIPSLPTASLADLQTKAGYVLDLANKLLVDNAQPIHQTIENVQSFSMALAANSGGVDAALKGLADLGKTIQPLADRMQTLSDDADKLVQAIDADKVRAIVDNVQGLSAKAGSVLDRTDKLIADNSGSVHSTLSNIDEFSKALGDNASNVDAALKSLADLGKTIGPAASRIQTLSEDADKVVKAVEPDKLRGVVDNMHTFSQSLAQSSDNFKTLVRDGASLATRLNDTSKRLDTALVDVDGLLKAVDSQKIAGIVNSVSDVAATVRDNRGNVGQTLKNFAEMSAKLNGSADKVDGLLTSAQGFLGAPGTKGAMAQLGDAAQSVRKLADDLDVRVKEISVGLNRFSNSGLRQFEALAIQGQRVLEDIDQTVRSFKQNPSQLIWGAKPSLPEYRARQ